MTKLIYSKSWSFNGVAGTPKFPTLGPQWADVVWYANPWEANSILIRAAAVTVNLGGGHDAMFLQHFMGNAWLPNADAVTPHTTVVAPANSTENMSWIASNSKIVYPSDCGMYFPGIAEAGGPWPVPDPYAAHLDLHVGVSPFGVGYSGFAQVWYTIEPPTP